MGSKRKEAQENLRKVRQGRESDGRRAAPPQSPYLRGGSFNVEGQCRTALQTVPRLASLRKDHRGKGRP